MPWLRHGKDGHPVSHVTPKLAVNRFEIPFSVHLCWNKVADGHDVRKLEPQLQVIPGVSLVLVGILCMCQLYTFSFLFACNLYYILVKRPPGPVLVKISLDPEVDKPFFNGRAVWTPFSWLKGMVGGNLKCMVQFDFENCLVIVNSQMSAPACRLYAYLVLVLDTSLISNPVLVQTLTTCTLWTLPSQESAGRDSCWMILCTDGRSFNAAVV